MNLLDIGKHLRERRIALGLSQMRLARLAGLSRATINQLENGTLKDLSFGRLAAVLEIVGLGLDARAYPASGNGLRMASRGAGVSYRRGLEADELADALASGHAPIALEPQLATLLDEAPLPLLVRAVDEAARRAKISPVTIWRHIERWAADWRSPRRALA